MENWFTTEKIDENTYVISEYKHWEETHVYLLISKSEGLLIDSGMGIGNILNEVRKITDLNISVVATHAHWDHIGGHGLFDSFFVHMSEEKWLNGAFPLPLNYIKSLVVEKPNDIPAEFDISHYEIFQGTPTRILDDGDIINIGNRKLEVIHTPGHSPGHMCFYERERGYLFTGDLIYKGKMTAFFPTSDPIQYKNSVDKIALIPAERIFPAHHSLDISTNIIKKVQQAFKRIEKNGFLMHCGKTFDFDGFQIQL